MHSGAISIPLCSIFTFRQEKKARQTDRNRQFCKMSDTAIKRAGLLNSIDSHVEGSQENNISSDNSNQKQPDRSSPVVSASPSSHSSVGGATQHSGEDSAPATGSTNVDPPSWKSLNTRVFDVYINDGSQKQKHLPDILDYKPPPTETESYSDRSHLLINTGQGRKVSLPATNSMVHKKTPQSLTANRAQSLSLALEQRISEKQISPLVSNPHHLSDISINANGSTMPSAPSSGPAQPQQPQQQHLLHTRHSQSSQDLPTPMSAMSFNSSTISVPENLNNNDKWAPNVETAFINALQLVMKNGTAKIKLKDNNYGRNELISIYIKNKTGEERSKKQISSHIQVWKKSIANKIHNDIQTTKFETQLLHLIENGAEQTAENWELFENTFNEILEQEQNSIEYSRHHQNMMPTQLGYMGQNGYMLPQQNLQQQQQQQQQHYHQQQAYSTMPIPHTVFVPQGASVPILPYHIPMKKEPATPIEFAQELYGSLKSFKCVPVNPYEPYKPYQYTSQLQQGAIQTPLSSGVNSHQPQTRPVVPQVYSNGTAAGTATMNTAVTSASQIPIIQTQPPLSVSSPSIQSLYQVAKEVENQQKKLIDERYQRQNLQQSHHLPHFSINQSPNQSHQYQPKDLPRRHPILPPASQLNATPSPVISNINPARS